MEESQPKIQDSHINRLSSIREHNETLIARESKLNLDITNEILLEDSLEKLEDVKQEYTPHFFLAFIPLIFAFQMIFMYPEMHNKMLKYMQWTFLISSTLYIFRPSPRYEKIYRVYFFIIETLSILLILFYNHIHYLWVAIELFVILIYYLVYSLHKRKGLDDELNSNTDQFTENKSAT